MSSTSEQLALPAAQAGWSRDAKVIALIAVAHFVSHVHVMLLPPILGPVTEAFGVSYTQIALALTAFNVASALLQTPAGFLVDRIGPRLMLTGRADRRGAAIAAAALLPGYWFFVIAYALMGVANTVYHPADYSDPVGRHRRQEDRQGLLDPHLRGLPGLRRDARHGAGLRRHLGLARRLPVRRRAVVRRGAAADRGRQRAAAGRAQAAAGTSSGRGQGRARPAAERRRSCATCCSSSASPWPVAASRPSPWSALGALHGTPASVGQHRAVGLPAVQRRRRAAGRHHRRPHAAP